MRLPGTVTTILLLACLALTAEAQLGTPGKDPGVREGKSSTPPASAEVAKGKKLFAVNCAVCHYTASAAKKIGPGLKNPSKRGTYKNGKPVDDASLRTWIEKGGKDMPGFKDSLSAEQIHDLIAYLKTL